MKRSIGEIHASKVHKTKREQLVKACLGHGWTVEGDEAICPRCGDRIRITRQAAITKHRYGQSFRTRESIEGELQHQERELNRLNGICSHLQNVVDKGKAERRSFVWGENVETAARDLRYCFRPARKEAVDRVKDLKRQLRDGCHLVDGAES